MTTGHTPPFNEVDNSKPLTMTSTYEEVEARRKEPRPQSQQDCRDHENDFYNRPDKPDANPHPTFKEALAALKCLHLYYQQPAIKLPSCMYKYINMPFAVAIANDPFKE